MCREFDSRIDRGSANSRVLIVNDDNTHFKRGVINKQSVYSVLAIKTDDL